MAGIWLNQDIVTCNPTQFNETVKKRLAYNCIQHWSTVVDSAVFVANHRMVKTIFGFEKYFSLLSFNQLVKLAHFRTTNNNLPANRRRVFEGIVRNEIIFSSQLTIRDVISAHECYFHKYADDTDLSKSASPEDFCSVQADIQSCIVDVLSWMNSNKLKLNTDKTELMPVGAPSRIRAVGGEGISLQCIT